MSVVTVLDDLERLVIAESHVRRVDERDRKLARKRVAGRVSRSRAVRDCLGSAKVVEGQQELVLGHVTKLDDGHSIAGFSQVMRCGLSNLCPWCASKVREERAQRINAALVPWLQAGGRVAFIVYTIASKPGEPIWATKKAMSRVTAEYRKLVRRDGFAQRAGVVGNVAGWEFTVRLDSSGHPHRNEILLFTEPKAADEIMARLPDLWVEAARICGRRATYEHGMRAEFPTLDADGRSIRVVSEYVSKGPEGWGAGQELTRSDRKVSRSDETVAPFELLDLIIETGDVSDDNPPVQAWRAYERAAKGTAVARFSRGLEALLARVAETGQLCPGSEPIGEIDDEPADEAATVAEEEALVEEAPLHAPPVVAFGRRAWRFVHRHGLQALILRVLEDLNDTPPNDDGPVDFVASIRYLLEIEGADPDQIADVVPPPLELVKGPFDD